MATTWNPADSTPGVGTFSNGNLSYSYVATTVSNYASIHGNLAKSVGKYQYEFLWTNVIDDPGIGIAQVGDPVTLGQFVGESANSWAYYATSAKVFSNNASVPPTVVSCSTGDLVGVLLDASNGVLWFTKNGTSVTGVPGVSGGWALGVTGVNWLPAGTFLGDAVSVPDSGTANFAGPFVNPVGGFFPWVTGITPPIGVSANVLSEGIVQAVRMIGY
jgi:hypothetical protein